MIKLQPVLKDYIWGGKKLKGLFGRDNGDKKISESWEVSVHPDGESKTENGTFSEYIKAHKGCVDADSSDFSILIKYIDAASNLSVQVHPSDKYAREHENDNGKTEMWYIISADAGAGIYCGFKKDTDKDEFLEKVKDGTVEELLNFIPVRMGDCFLIEPGTVHAIGAGCVICEIQQSSNVTYRVYDYNRLGADGKPRQLHVDKAVEVINFNKFENKTNSGEVRRVSGGEIQLLTECKYFRVNKLILHGEYEVKNDRSYTTVNVLSGEGIIENERFSAGDSFFISCGESVNISGNAEIILSSKSQIEYFAGLDLGGTFVKCGIVDSHGRMVINGKAETSGSYKMIAKCMSELALSLAKEAGVTLSAIGIGAPGTVDSMNGIIVYSNNLGWDNVPLAKDIERFSSLPVFVTNDANAAALGEFAYGSGRLYNNIIFVTLGTGVGGGIVIDGKLYEGQNGAGAELGHVTITDGGKKCTCGRCGCLEAYASAGALVRRAAEYATLHRNSLLFTLCNGDTDKLDGKTFFKALETGDDGAKEVFAEYIRYLSSGLVNFANIFRPDAVILGGGISAVGNVLTDPLNDIMNKEVFGGNRFAPVKVITSVLKNDAGTYGAARLAIEHLRK